MRRIGLLLSVVSLLATPFLTQAQDLPDVAQGLQPYTGLQGGALDKVNPTNGALTIRIPLVSYPQKGSLALSYSLIINSFGFQVQQQCAASPGGPAPKSNNCTSRANVLPSGIFGTFPLSGRLIADQLLFGAGANMADPTQTYQPQVYGRFYVVSADNAEHPLAMTDTGYRSIDEAGYLFAPTDAPKVNDNLGTMTTTSGSSNGMGAAAGTITDARGIAYTTSSMTDPDGNVITFPSAGSYSQQVYASGLPATDSAGRSIAAPGSGTAASCPTILNSPASGAGVPWTVPGPGGSVTFTFCYTNVIVRTHFVPGSGSNGAAKDGNQDVYTSKSMLQSIVLPNGTFWAFIYDSGDPATPAATNLGQITTLIYPTGGMVNYSYVPYQNESCDAARTSSTGVTVYTYMPQVTSRTMLDSAGKTWGQWTYSYPAYNPSGSSGSVTNLNGDVTVNHYVSDGTPCGIVDGGSDFYQGNSSSGTLLRSTRTIYNTPGGSVLPYAGAARPSKTTNTLASGKASASAITYSSPLNFYSLVCDYQGQNCTKGLTTSIPIGQPVSTSEIDYDGSIKGVRATTYQWQVSSAYLAGNLLELPATTTVSDSANNTWSKTVYSYDESAYSPGGTRGHQTSRAMADLQDNTSPTTHTGWNSVGMRSFTIDANTSQLGSSAKSTGHTDDFAYDPNLSCNGTLVTGHSNALSQHTAATYDCNTGLLTSLTDSNGNTSTASWDPMRRLLELDSPALDRGVPKTTFVYNDTQRTVQRTTLANPDPAQNVTVSFDVFGREVNRATADSPSSTNVDTTYDSNGRTASVSNPYRSTSDQTYGITTFTYDALGRKIITMEPSGLLITCYDGIASASSQGTCPANASSIANASWMDSYDESGRHTQHLSDALGRLIAVMEPDPSSGQLSRETDYRYSPLGDLMAATQVGQSGEVSRNRSFSYDSLSRLRSSTNPETGTICYGTWSGGAVGSGSCQNGYDPNGNLVAKTDARGIQTSYTYDSLNRLTYKRYSDGTPLASFGYDGNAEGGQAIPQSQNAIGRMSTSSNEVNVASLYSYDAMGRLSNQYYYVPTNNIFTLTASAAYDLAGEMTDLVYPDGRHVVQTFGSDGRVQTIGETGAPGSYLQSQTYNPDGSSQTMTLGNQVTQTVTENNRLQVQAMNIISTPTGTQPLLSRVYCYANCQAPLPGVTVGCFPGPCQSSNNGNILQITDALNSSRSQSFTYDGLNRISTFSLGGILNQQYTTDSFGNAAFPISFVDQTSYTPQFDQHNQVTNNPVANFLPNGTPIYDPSGNLSYDLSFEGTARKFTYDAENRIANIATPGQPAFEAYLYGPDGTRVLKGTQTDYTEYITFGGQPIAEVGVPGLWTDYIFAGGKRIARVSGLTSTLHTKGTRNNPNVNQGCGSAWDVSVAGWIPKQIVPGDKLVWYQKENVAQGGLTFMLQGGDLLVVPDEQQNPYTFTDTTPADPTQWHKRSAPLDVNNYTGRILDHPVVTTQNTTPAQDWEQWIADAVIVNSNTGLITPVFTGSPASGSLWSACGVANAYLGEDSGTTDGSNAATHFYMADHLGSAQMEFSGGGWPVAMSQFMPYGGEINPQATANHFKFTGKERDTESGLDYFGARYYASSMGRFMSPDPIGITMQSLLDPQQWNGYQYSKNNPLRFTDPTGLYVITPCASGDKACAKTAAQIDPSIQRDLKSKDPAVRAAAAAYGKLGDANGVTVTVGDPGAGHAGITTVTGLQANSDGSFSAQATVTIRPGQSGADLDSTVGHEGQHVEDAQGFAATVTSQGFYDLSKNLTSFQTELNAYRVTNSILNSNGAQRGYQCDGGPCVLGQGIVNPDPTIRQMLATPASRGGYGVTDANQGSRQNPNITTPNPKP